MPSARAIKWSRLLSAKTDPHMDFATIFQFLLIGLAVALAATAIGFFIPSPLRRITDESEVLLKLLPAANLAAPVQQKFFSSLRQGDIPAPRMLAAWGRGRISSSLRFIGRVWLPLSWNLYLIPGEGFVLSNHITWMGRLFIRGGEEYRGGKGGYLLAREPVAAPFLDETERTLAWLYSIWLTPGSLLECQAAAWTDSPAGELQLEVREGEKPVLQFKLVLDPNNSVLQKINTTRKGSKTGGDYPFVAEFSAPKKFGDMGILPAHLKASWDNDPYLKLELHGIVPNIDVQPYLEAGIEDLKS